MSVKLEIVGGTWEDALEQAVEIGGWAARALQTPDAPTAAPPPLSLVAPTAEQGPGTVTPINQPPPPLGPGPAAAQPLLPGDPSAIPDLDSQGQPWDERIHARTKTKKKDKSWTVKRGAAAALIAQVRAEHAAAAATTAVVVPAAPVAGAVTVPPVAAVGAPDVATTLALCSTLLAAAKTPEMIVSISAQINTAMAEVGLTGNANGLLADPSLAPALHEKLRVIGTGLGLQC